ncbi:hypothetical protein ACJX0J_024176, partial [Zea mays]
VVYHPKARMAGCMPYHIMASLEILSSLLFFEFKIATRYKIDEGQMMHKILTPLVILILHTQWQSLNKIMMGQLKNSRKSYPGTLTTHLSLSHMIFDNFSHVFLLNK